MRAVKYIGIVMALAIVGMGCAALGGMSDTDLVCDVMTQWDAAMKAGDVDAVMAFYSEDYEGMQGMGRDRMREMLEQFLPRMAEAEESVFDLSAAVPTVEGDTATFGPVTLQMGQRSFDLQYNLAKGADGVWRITGTNRAE